MDRNHPTYVGQSLDQLYKLFEIFEFSTDSRKEVLKAFQSQGFYADSSVMFSYREPYWGVVILLEHHLNNIPRLRARVAPTGIKVMTAREFENLK